MILFYYATMEGLAKKIAEDEKIFLGKISWGLFPDGMPNTFIKDVCVDVEGRDVAFLASFDDPAEIFRQLSVIYALPRYDSKSFRVILPYFPGTMERVEREGEVATAMTLVRMFNAVECEKVPLYIFDIHDKHERFYFRHPIIPRLKSAIPLLTDRLSVLDDKTAKTVCFPDEGAYKRFGHAFDERHDKILCHKERFGDKRKVKIIEGSPKGKHVIIVDDLVMTGGTLLECAKALERKGAKSVSAYATHAVFPNKSYFNMNKFPFANFWVTDSCPETIKGFKDCKTKFEVLSLAPSIAKILLS
ncbi:MAG: ribose-phosphate diphosphokinase [bacterium]|nr:ribose-phosphate diphosphokinase [bacterium]